MAIVDTGLGLDKQKIKIRTFTILSERDRYFADLIDQMRKKYPTIKLIYANNTMGSKINADRPNPDFIIIAKATLVSTDNDPRKPPKKIMLIDAPMLFSERSLAGWTLAVEEGNMQGYFDYMLEKAVRIDEDKFYEYIKYMALLSTDPNDELYWKKIENTDKLVTEIEELQARYAKRSANKMSEKRGYTNKA